MVDFLNTRSSLATDPLRNFRFLARFIPLGINSSDLRFDFRVGFTSIQGLSIQTESIPYREGGFNTVVHNIPGQQSFSPVTFQRGVVVGTRQNWEWFRKIFDPASRGWSSDPVGAATGSGTFDSAGLTADYRCRVVVSVLGHPRPATVDNAFYSGTDVAAGNTPSAYMQFSLLNAWPTNLAYSDLNATDNAVFVEQMTVVHEGLDIWWENNSAVDQPTRHQGWSPGRSGIENMGLV